MRGIIWFREDLRISDNTALHHACAQCTDGVIAVFVLNDSMWRKHHVAACRVDFVLRGLRTLSESLAKLNIPLLILEVKNTKEILTELFRLITQHKAQALFFNKQYEVNESRRDQAVEAYLLAHNVTCHSYHDQLILTPGTIKTQSNTFFSVFTPYKRAWQKVFLQQNNLKALPTPKPQTALNIKPSVIPKKLAGFESAIPAELWPAGEKIAHEKLSGFIEEQLFKYDQQRDFPAIDGTSQLSPYLATGMISARQCFAAALDANQHEIDTGNKGALTWMSELIWREFYKTILIAFPRVSMHQPFQEHTKKIKWNYDEKLLLAWQQGKTGYPIVDASMRQLNATGWMHNRLRMVVAMFFSKNLFLDWRLGEQYFMEHLIDGDLAANNGGWQWSASTGTDAAPYFRIFNPTRQSERFDPSGTFIRHYCPELSHLSGKDIHEPYTKAPLLISTDDYPKPIVDFSKTRQSAINAFNIIKN
jgi:deoxyribodipyrimidine photo-lyase